MDDNENPTILIEYQWQHACTQISYANKPHKPPDDPIPRGWHEEIGGADDVNAADGAWVPFAATGNLVHWRRLIWRPMPVFDDAKTDGGEQ